MNKIIFNKKDCIGCGSCSVVCPSFWELLDNGKANLKNARLKDDGDFELEIEEKDLACNEEAISFCPVQVIKIEK